VLPAGSDDPAFAGQAYELAAQAHARLLDYDAAFDALERASKLYDDARDPHAPARLLCIRLRILALTQQNLSAARTLLDQAERLRSNAAPSLQAEFALLQAWCHHAAGDADAARRTLDAASTEHPPLPPAAQARRALTRAALATHPEDLRRHVADAADHLRTVQPPSARLSVLAEFPPFPRNPHPDPAAIQTLLVEWPDYPDAHPSAFIRHLRAAHLHRMLGGAPDADLALESATRIALESASTPTRDDATFRVLLATWPLPGPGPLRRRILDAWAPPNPPPTLSNWTEPVLGILKAEQHLHEGAPHAAAQALVRAGNAFASRPQQDVWALLLLHLALGVRATLPRDSTDLAEIGSSEVMGEIHRLQSILGHAPTPPPAPLQAGSPQPDTVPPTPPPSTPPDFALHLPGTAPGLIPDRTPISWEPVIDRMLASVEDLIHDLVDRAQRSATLPGDATPIALRMDRGPAAALPWELIRTVLPIAPILRLPIDAIPASASASPPAASPPSVHLLRARQHRATRGSNDTEQTQGWSVETGYLVAFRHPPILSHAPDPKVIGDVFKRQPPTLIHITAAIREFGGGTFLDFESTEDRTFAQRGEDRGFWTVTLLDWILSSLPAPPFVVLDIVHPLNDAEAIRMLLLRNLFAADLLALGHTRGILATGLAAPGTPTLAYDTLPAALANGATPNHLMDVLLGPPARLHQHLTEAPLPLFPHATALFTATPDAPILAPAGPGGP
jgi:tetratricopeptide (TPR) repeat protein